MSTIEVSIVVDVPINTAYNHWTRFEDFPRFMAGVESVEQVSPDLVHWTAKIAGVRRAWDARISEQRPDELIAWVSTEGPLNSGVISFEAIDLTSTRLITRISFEPTDTMEEIGDALQMIETRVKGDLERFKAFVESLAEPEPIETAG